MAMTNEGITELVRRYDEEESRGIQHDRAFALRVQRYKLSLGL